VPVRRAVREGATPDRRPPDDKVEPLLVARRSTEQAHLVLASRSVDRFDPAATRLAVLNHVLGGGLSSRLFQEIRERRGLAYSVWSERVAYGDAGSVSVGMGTAPEHVAEVLDIVTSELELLGEKGITERELTIAKGNLRAETLLACEDSGARMSRIGAGLLLHGEVLSVDEVLDRVAALTLEECTPPPPSWWRHPGRCRWSAPSRRPTSIDSLPRLG
jgi:predicted Zn-dependent peptidase